VTGQAPCSSRGVTDISDDRGFTVLESLIACAVLATALLSIGYLSTNAFARLAESRSRTVATLIAMAKLEELRADRAPAAGTDVVDGLGEPIQRDSARRFDRRWSVVPISPDVQILTVVVTPLPAASGREVRLRSGWTRRR
jgi:Tfp pilus assembly protein PilE